MPATRKQAAKPRKQRANHRYMVELASEQYDHPDTGERFGSPAYGPMSKTEAEKFAKRYLPHGSVVLRPLFPSTDAPAVPKE